MKKLLICFLSCILILVACSIQAQQNKIDSLITVLKTAIKDTSKVNALNDLSRQYSNIGDYELALQYAQQALQQSQNLLYE
ncbi:MAG: adenylate/guanylate cyclase domain-containing protein, partial [Bacteroidota bacterium]|nr:adenylate/guanylate cyclase domain-containing protein [Bacteroidota bacterium]